MRILKDHKITLHGAHVLYLGAPIILLLASAYASGKIERKVFINTLNTLVRCVGAGETNRWRLRPQHLVTLGISEADASKVPLIAFGLDKWTITGLLSRITDISDFELLYNPAKKGEFFKRHFETLSTNGVDGSTSDYPFRGWDPYKILLDTPRTYRTHNFQSQIQIACEYLERGTKWYDPPMHVMLRLAAASLKDRHLDIIGPFVSIGDMEKTVADIFHIVEPDFDGEDFYDHENFNFEEPAVPPPKSHPRQAGGGRVIEEDNEIDNDSTAEEQDELIRDIQQVTKDMLKRAGIDQDVEIPAKRIAAQLGFGAAGAAEGKRRDANASRPPSCVIV